MAIYQFYPIFLIKSGKIVGKEGTSRAIDPEALEVPFLMDQESVPPLPHITAYPHVRPRVSNGVPSPLINIPGVFYTISLRGKCQTNGEI